MFKLRSEEYFQTKPVLNFAWGGSTHAEALGLKASFSMSLMRTRALLKWIYKLKCLHRTYLRTCRETCLFPVTLHWLSWAITRSARRSKEQINPAPFPVPLPWGFALPCSPGATAQLTAPPLLALVPTQAHLFITYYVTHTLLHLFKQPYNFRCFH